MTRQNRVLRRMSIALVLLIAAANGTSLVLLVRELVSGGRTRATCCCWPRPRSG